MEFPRLSHHLRQQAQTLRASARTLARSGQVSLANACHGAADALFRGDEIGAQHWLEKADVEHHALMAGA